MPRETTPKPLLVAGGKPLIVWHLEKLAAIGIRDVVINTSWLAEQFPATLGDGRFNSGEWQNHRALTPQEPLLFRFSALTFNTHRIHYDLPYARDFERYRGLVVHGPLMASLLLQLGGPMKRFAFRAVSPAIVGESLHLVSRAKGDALALGAFADDGRQVVQAEATR